MERPRPVASDDLARRSRDYYRTLTARPLRQGIHDRNPAQQEALAYLAALQEGVIPVLVLALDAYHIPLSVGLSTIRIDKKLSREIEIGHAVTVQALDLQLNDISCTDVCHNILY